MTMGRVIRDLTPDIEREVLAKYAGGTSSYWVAHDLGLRYDDVSRLLHERGVVRGGHPRSRLQPDRPALTAAPKRDRSVPVMRNPLARVPPDHLAVLCWCDRFMVAVPKAAVMAGRTATCGRPDCHAP